MRPLRATQRITLIRCALGLITAGIVMPTFVLPERAPLAARDLPLEEAQIAAVASPAAVAETSVADAADGAPAVAASVAPSVSPRAAPPQTTVTPTGPSVPSGASQRAFLDITVNGVRNGQSLVLIRGDDLLVPLKDLDDAGVRDLTGSQEQTPAGPYVSLSSLKPALTYIYDESNLSVAITVDPAHLTRSVLDLDGKARNITVTRAKASGYANYALTATSNRTLTISGETNVALGGALVSSTFVRSSNGAFGTGQTSVTLDNLRSGRRTVLGMTSLQGDGRFDGSASIEGISVTRNFDLDPNLIRSQPSELGGIVATPSTAQVFVNGVLVRSEEISPGSFTLANLPVSGGANVTTVVLKDAFGKTTTIQKPLYVAPALLKSGLVSYAFGVGRLRNADPALGKPLAYLGFVRAGISRASTVSGFADGSPTARAFGTSFATANRFGSFEIDLAASNGIASGVTMNPLLNPLLAPTTGSLDAAAPPPLAPGTPARGNAMALSYEYHARAASFAFSLERRSPFFANLGEPVLGDRAVLDHRAGISFPVGKQGVSITETATIYRDRAALRQLVIASGFSIRRLGAFSFGIGRQTEGGRSSPIARLGFNMSLPHGASLNATSETASRESSRGVQIGRQSAGANGFSYLVSQVQDLRTRETARNAQLTLGTPIANLQLDTTQSGRAFGSSLVVSGAIAAVSNAVTLSAPINGSFALVDLDGVRGVGTSVNNRVYGRTDRRGRILVPDLFPYQRNEIGVRGADAPEDVLIDTDKKVVAPSYRGGIVVKFPAKRIRSYAGSLEIRTGSEAVIPAYGAVTLGDPNAGFGSDIGADGGIYFENVSPGTYPARISFAEGTCDFTITIPKSDVAVKKLGRLTCNGPIRPPVDK